MNLIAAAKAEGCSKNAFARAYRVVVFRLVVLPGKTPLSERVNGPKWVLRCQKNVAMNKTAIKKPKKKI